MIKIKWIPDETQQVFTKARDMLATGVEYSWEQLFNEAQQVLPEDRRNPHIKSSTLHKLTLQYRDWKEGKPILEPKKGRPSGGKNVRQIRWSESECNLVFAEAKRIRVTDEGIPLTVPKLFKQAQMVLPVTRHKNMSSANASQLHTLYKKWLDSSSATPEPKSSIGKSSINFCPACGTKIDPKWSFCPNDGFNLAQFKK